MQNIITAIKAFYSFIIVSLIAALVVSCASSSGGGGGGGNTAETSIFSHSSYTFIPLNANISQTSTSPALVSGSIPTNRMLLGSVLIKKAEINKLVAAEINKLITEEDSKVDTNDISINNDYKIEYSFVDDAAENPSPNLNRYLIIVPNSDNSGARIYASNPFAFNISLTDILMDIPSVKVKAEVTITVSSLVKSEISISHTVPVHFPKVVDTLPNVNDAVSFNLPNKFTPGKNIPQNIISNQSYTGNLSGNFAKGTVINGSATISFTSLWMGATKQLTSSESGTIDDNTFKLSDLLNVTELSSLSPADIGIIQNITVTLTPEGASQFNYTYPAPAPLSATAEAPISVDILNGNISVANSLWKAISDENSTFTETNDDGIHVLNISIGWSFTYTYQRDFQPNDVIVPKTFLLNYTTPFVEEQAATTTISINGVNNALNRYGFTPNPGTEETRTIFFALLDSSATQNLCYPDSIYLDNIDTQIKNAVSFNYEELDNEADRLLKCVLGASFDGENYQALTAAISNTTIVNSKQASDCPHGAAGEFCYYASLTINITNLDEAPTITAPPLSIGEGVGAINYPDLRPALGEFSENAPTTGNLSDVRGDITIADADEADDRITKLSVNALETKVISVSPAHGNGLFSIVKQEGNNGLFTLRVDASSLDYEGFQPGELKEGKAIYMVTIATKDTDGTVANVKTQQIPIEITDAIFAPVGIGEGLGFTKAANIESRSDRIVLLSGASMIANGRSTLGTVKAVNPETNSDNELFYAVFPNDSRNNPEQTSNNFAVVDGFGDGGIQTLVLNNLGLDTNLHEFTLHVQAFYRPANFNASDIANINLSLFNNTRNRNFIDMDRSIAIRIAVDNTAYSDSSDSASYIDRTKSLNPARSPIFRARQFTGNVTEATSGDNVTGVGTIYYTTNTFYYDNLTKVERTYLSLNVSTFDFPPFYPNFVNISQAAPNLALSPEFALVGAEGFGAFNAAQLRGLGVNPTHSALFSINKSTGAISLKGVSEVEFPDFYTMVVRLANASDINNAGNAFLHDYATVSVLVNDINSAPVISPGIFGFTDFTAPDIQVVNGIGIYNETTNALTLNVTINENTPAGTVLARFTVTDDNDDMFGEHQFTFGADMNREGDDYFQDAVKLTFTPAASAGKQKKSTATLTLVKPLNFEDFSQVTTQYAGNAVTITNDIITLSEIRTISDKGRYEFNPLTQSQPEPISPAQNVLSTSLLTFNLMVLDVTEKLLIDIEDSVTSGSIMEDAPVGTAVNGINITIANINETDADALVYELSDEKFAEVFNATATVDGVVQLIVADADKLENLGDGLVHTSTLTITNNTGGTGPQDRSDPITIQVTVIDVQQPINSIIVNTIGLQVKETDVDGDFSDAGGDRRYVITDNLFVYNLTDISKDADDFVSIGGREPAPLVTLSYAMTDVFLESSTPDDATDIDVTDGINFDILSLLSLNPPDENNNVGLAIENTDYVEASLFGNITATLDFTGTFVGNAQLPETTSIDVTVEVIKANPKNVEYNTTSDTAPVYLFKYIQSNYADEVTADNVRANVILASAIVSAGGSTGGLPTGGAQPQINVANNIYNTALVRLNGDDGYFIERDFAKLNEIRVAKNNQQKIDAGVIVIPFTSNKNITVANIQILSEDASGKLEDSADSSDNLDNFHNYFDIKVNNTYNFASEGSPEDIRKALLITQKQFAVINSNGEIDGSSKYNALDTIPLFKEATETTSQTYYIRVSQGDNPSNASNYALAQVHLNIEAAELNIPAVVGGLFISPYTSRYSISTLTDLTAGTGNISENSITPNAFDIFLNINVTNEDYVTYGETTTRITVSVPTGGLVPTPTSNRATDDQLIAISLPGGLDNLPGANTVDITYDGIGGSDTRQIRFALARNVYGSATINVSIQENDEDGIEIYSNLHTFTLNVNEDTSGDRNGNYAPTLAPVLSYGVINVSSNNLNFTLAEDTGLLNITDGTESKSITIMPIFASNNDDARRKQLAIAVVKSVSRVDGVAGLSNTKRVDVFDYDSDIMNNTLMSYQKHGWGITDITYRVIETELRGFRDMVNATIYDEDEFSRVTVTQMNDDAVFVNATPVNYNLNGIEISQGVYDSNNNLPTRPLTLTYSDPDLRFSNFSIGDVVPAMIIPGIQTRVPSHLADTLTITPAAGTEPVEVPNSELFTVTFTSNFSTISATDYGIINALGEGGVYTVPFTGDNVEDANASIRIAADTHDHVIADSSTDIFESNGIEVPLTEASSIFLYTITHIRIEDADFARPLPLGAQENITFSIDSVIEKVRESSGDTPRDLTDKFSWSSTVLTDERDNQIRGNFLTQEDVGTYTVTWSTTERYSAAGGPRTHTGFFVLNFKNTPSPFNLQGGDITIDYPHDGMGALNSTTNRTIATIGGINITGDDMSLPDHLGYGILLTITPENIDREGENSFTNASGNEVSVIELLGRNYKFDDDFALKHFISFADITPGGTLPAFKLVVDDELAGDEFNITVNAALAISESGTTEDANPVGEANEQAGSITLATGYDIQSPPSDVRIAAFSANVIPVNDERTILNIPEGRPAGQELIDVRFRDKNIEGDALEEFAGAPIDEFNATMVFYNSDKTERQSSIEIIDPNEFQYDTGEDDMANVQFFFPAYTNADVGVKQFEITVTDNRTKNAPVVTLNGTLNIIGVDSNIAVATQLMTDLPGVTQELNYNDNDVITVLVNITSEDFVEGGGNYSVSDFSFADSGLYVVEKGQDLAINWKNRASNRCSLPSISFDEFQDITNTIGNKTDKQRFFKFTIGVQELNEAIIQDTSEVGGVCARLDYDIVGTYFEDFEIQLNNSRPVRSIDQTYDSQGIVDRYSRTGTRDEAPIIQNLVEDGLEDVRYATGRSATERTFTVHANFRDGDPGDDGDINYALASSSDSDCKIGDEFDNAIDNASWNIELREGIAKGTECTLTLTVTEGVRSVTKMITIQVPKSVISYSGFISVTANGNVISPPYDTGILAGDNVSITLGIQDNDGDGDTDVVFGNALSNSRKCKRVNPIASTTYNDINRRVTALITSIDNITTNAECTYTPQFLDGDTLVDDFPQVTVRFTPRPNDNVPPIFSAASESEVSQFTPAAGDTPASYSFANIPSFSPIGYLVGNISATDTNFDTLTYNITAKYSINGSNSKVDNTLFQIDSTTGEITLQVQAVANDLGEYTFSANVSDGKGEHTEATISVSVIDSTPPVFTSAPYNFDLSLSMANAPGVVVGKVLAMDAQGTPFDYSLPDSDDSFEDFFELASANNPDGSRNIILRRAATLSDFAASSVTFQVVATLQVGGFSSEATITVNLDNDLPLSDDSDTDGIADLYDADPYNAAVNVTGSGASGDPYIISNIYQLQAISGVDHRGTALNSSAFTNNGFLYGTTAAEQLTKHYKLNQNINASATNTGLWNKSAVGSDRFIGRGWTPIAGKDGDFSGSFSGEGYAISNLNMILRSVTTTNTFGLFGVNSGNISAVGLENIEMRIQAFGKATTANTIFSANKGNGGLVGKNEQAGIIQYSYVSGLVNATANTVGGLVGSNLGEISYSYSTAAVEGRLDVGGLVGSNTEGGRVLSTYATGNVSEEAGYRQGDTNQHNTAGGLIGYVDTNPLSTLSASYAIGEYITGNIDAVAERNNLGSLVGQLGLTTAITSSYWYHNPDIMDIKGIGNHDDNTVPGHTGLSNAQLQECQLNGMPSSDTTCANLFPAGDWGDDTTDGVTRGWIFNAGEYPSLRAVRTSGSKQLLPSAAQQECQRNGMPLDC